MVGKLDTYAIIFLEQPYGLGRSAVNYCYILQLLEAGSFAEVLHRKHLEETIKDSH